MKNGSRSGSPNRRACSTFTPFKKYPISSETLYSEILTLITQGICTADEQAWRFQLKLDDEFQSVASLQQIEAAVAEVVVDMNLEGVSHGVRAGEVC